MDIRYWTTGIVCALAFTGIGCNQIRNTSGEASGSTPYKVQRITLLTQTLTTGGDPLALYKEDLDLLSRRIQASAEDRWYLTAHKDGQNKQINHDLETIVSDIEDIGKISAAHPTDARLHNTLNTLRQDSDRMVASIKTYMTQDAQAGHDQWLNTVHQDMKTSQDHLTNFIKAKKPANNMAKL